MGSDLQAPSQNVPPSAPIGTGRYREFAIAALRSVREHVGMDCLVSLHLLSDNVTGVPPEFNAKFAPYVPEPVLFLCDT